MRCLSELINEILQILQIFVELGVGHFEMLEMADGKDTNHFTDDDVFELVDWQINP